MINRGEHWQCGYVIANGSLDATRRGGLDAFRREVARLAPFAADRVGELRGWDQVKPLTVRVDRARRWWRPGLLCIGDAAHAAGGPSGPRSRSGSWLASRSSAGSRGAWSAWASGPSASLRISGPRRAARVPGGIPMTGAARPARPGPCVPGFDSGAARLPAVPGGRHGTGA
jgi:hypothetical protein